MNFEQLLEKKPKKVFFKKKSKKYFEFQIDSVTFHDLILFQNISIKIVNVPFQEKSILSSNSDKLNSFNWLDVFILFSLFIFSYFFIVEFLTLWYKENIECSDLYSNDQVFLKESLLSFLSSNLSFPKFLIFLETSFNSSVVDFLSIYGYLS